MDVGALTQKLWETTGFVGLSWGNVVMILISVLLLYLAIAKKFEPLLLIPIAFGAILANLPNAPIINPPSDGMPGGLLYYLSFGVRRRYSLP